MPEGKGNEEQIRTIAEQLFEVWEANRKREEKENRRWVGGNLAGWLAAAAIVVGVIVTWANTYGLATSANARSIQNETNIETMKIESSDRLGRIETKIDLMLEDMR